MRMSSPVTRFAPSPTGRLHLGNVRTALFNYLLARREGGRFLLRIEDSDRARGGEDLLEALLVDLRWLGLEWDAGPGAEDEWGPYRQSERDPLYAEAYATLEQGGRAYPCFCSALELEVSRKTQLAAGQPPRYAGTCRDLDDEARTARIRDGRQPSLRFRVDPGKTVSFDDLVRGPQAFVTDDLGDFVIRRADGAPMFFFCNALDDALMRVTHVLRGEDHLSNTPRQLLLLEALGMSAPVYGHLPLLLGREGRPLSKREDSAGLHSLRQAGFLPAAILNYLLRLGHAGAPDGWVEPADLPSAFNLDKVGRAPAHFDESQLLHWQREAVNRLDPAALAAWMASAVVELDADRLTTLAAVAGRNLNFPAEARDWAGVLYGELPPMEPAATLAIQEAGPAFFAAALEALDSEGPDLAKITALVRARTGSKGARLYMPLRAALTGLTHGPELAPLLKAMDPSLLRRRLAAQAGHAGETT
ncbi:MAG: glutamate--tRNA ligase [Steroidobacteraceae bacterium]